MLDLTQADLARKVNCSISMLRKIERDERRPSEQLAALLADCLAIEHSQRESFLQLARGRYLSNIQDSIQVDAAPVPVLTQFKRQDLEQSLFVARERELRLLQEHLGQAVQGRGGFVFISGEAGQGKTSLLCEFARRSLAAWPDLVIVGGSCDVYTGQGDPLLPFRDIFRMLAGDLDNSGMRGMITQVLVGRLSRAIPVFTEILLDHGPHLIDTLVSGGVLEAHLAHSYPHHPENTQLLLRLKALRARQALDSDGGLRQDSLFDEIGTTLNALAHRQPLMLIIDDLHWIDHSSAALLGRLSMRLKRAPILIVGSYRPEDLAQRERPGEGAGGLQHPLQEVLSESLRQFGDNRIDLDYADPQAGLEFVNALLDSSENTFSEPFRRQLTLLTEGHPLFVVELLRDMRERGDIIRADDGRWMERTAMSWGKFPARVEGVIEKRLTRLSAELYDLLAVASVQGETFFAEVIAAIRKANPGELTRRLSAELDRRHRLIHEQGVARSGPERLSQYRFRHHLFQKYLYGRLAPAERMYLHEAVGNALETLFERSPGADELPAARLARHFQEARLSYKASKYLLLAGQKAARLLAFDQAAEHFELGLSLLADLPRTPAISRREYELKLALARALWHSGRVLESVASYEQSIEIARTLDDPHALTRAVLAYEEPRWRLNLDSELSQRTMREALTALGEEQSGPRVRLLVNLARSLLAFGQQEELRPTVDQALTIARQIEDPLALCDALRIKAQIDRRPELTAERMEAIQEMIAIAESIQDQERLADSLDLYVYDLLELGQMDLADQMIAAQRRVAQEIKQPFQLHIAAVFQTMRAIMRGEFETAERLANEASELSQQIGLAEMDGIFGIHMFTIRREQGRLNEIAPVVKIIAAHSLGSSVWRPGLALIYRDLGLEEQCRTVFESLASDGFASVPQDSLQVATLAYLSEVCTYLGDVDRAAVLYNLLLPYESRVVVVGAATACHGAAGRYLGILAAVMLDWQAAERHFRQAIDLDERMGAWPWLAHSRCEYAAMLLRSGRAADQGQVKALLDEAALAAGTLGMAYLAQKVAGLRSCDAPISG